MNDFSKGNTRGQWDQMVTTVLRKMLLVLTSKTSAPASHLLPSDLPCVSSMLHPIMFILLLEIHVWCTKMNAKSILKRKKGASPVCEHYSNPPSLLPCEVRQPCASTTPPLLKPGTFLPGARRAEHSSSQLPVWRQNSDLHYRNALGA